MTPIISKKYIYKMILKSGHQPDSTATQPLTPGGALTPGAISAAVKTELNLIPKAEIDSRSTPHQVTDQV